MSEASLHLAVCVPTYCRPRLLRLLLEDLGRQTVSIDRLIIVDGDPSSADVPETLEAAGCQVGELLYVPSNHANLPYQRYLGWRAASGSERLLYLDDDLRLLSPHAIETLMRPLRTDRGRVVGVTTEFGTAPADPEESSQPLRSRSRLAPPRWKDWIGRFGSLNRVPYGGLSPAGHRRRIGDRNKPYELVGCLRGGAMAYRISAITADCFPDALFAMGERGWGLGEDTLLSRLVGSRGVLLTALKAGIVHPGGHDTVAYRPDAFGHGYATAYSRRLLNDHFRGFDPPRWADRLALVNSYAANVVLSWLAAAACGADAAAFARGYTLGAVQGLIGSPASRRLCPAIDWHADAEAALSQVRNLTPVLT